jgi:hypothetical protein
MIEKQNKKLNEIQKEMSTLQVNSVSDKRQMKLDLEKLTLQNNDYLIEIKNLREEIAALKLSEKYLMTEKVHQTKLNAIEFTKLEQKISTLQTSSAFRLGQLLRSSFSKPGGNIVLFPVRFMKLIFQFLVKRIF